MNIPQPPVILANLDSFIAGAFMVIAFIGWVANLVNQNQPAGKQQRRPPGPPAGGQPRPGQRPNAPPQKNLQAEIDQFLGQSRPAPPQRRREEPATADGVEVVSRPRPQRRPPQSQDRQRTKREVWEEQVGRSKGNAARPRPTRTVPPSPAAQPARPQPVVENPPPSTTTLAERHIVPSISAAQRMIRSASEDRIETSVARDMASQLVSNIATHLGAFQATAATSAGEQALAGTTKHLTTRADRMRQMLRSRSRLQEAYLMGEILSKPRALRR